MKHVSRKILAATCALAVALGGAAALNVTASAEGQIAEAYLIGAIGTNQSWVVSEEDVTVTDGGAEITPIDGDAQYSVTWDLPEAAETGDSWFLTVCIAPTIGGVQIVGEDGSDVNFTTDSYPDLTASIDAVYIDGEQLSDYSTSSAAINTAYYEDSAGVTRLYLHDDWASTGVNDVADCTMEKNITVVFTISGTGYTGTSNVTADTGSIPEDADDEDTVVLDTGDVNGDGNINAVDAHYILVYTAKFNLGPEPAWEDILAES